jgi:hypothetical protein
MPFTIKLLAIGQQNKFVYLYLITFDWHCTLHVYITKKIGDLFCGIYTWQHYIVYIQGSKKTNNLSYTQTDCGCKEKCYSWQVLSTCLVFLFFPTNSRTGVTADHHKEALEEFEGTKRLIEKLKSKTESHYNGQKKKDERTRDD